MNQAILFDLLKSDALDESDRSGKTLLDKQIEEWSRSDHETLEQALIGVLVHLLEGDWKQWRALRQVIWRLKFRSEPLANALASLSDDHKPESPRARFQVYLARSDLARPASLAELNEDNDLRNNRPAEWLQLIHSEATPAVLRGEYLRLAKQLHAKDFTFVVSRLRDKYADNFVEWITELCRAMPFEEAVDLGTLVDEEFGCGVYNDVISNHPGLKRDHIPVEPTPQAENLWGGFDPPFRDRIIEKA